MSLAATLPTCEADDAALSRRLRFFAKAVALLEITTYPVGLAELRGSFGLSWAKIALHPVQAQLALALWVAVLWGFLEARPRRRSALESVDATLCVGFSVAWISAVVAASWLRSDRVVSQQVDTGSATVAIALLVVGRAALVPSPPRRTAILSALAFAPVLALAYVRSAVPTWATDQPPLVRIVGQQALVVLVATLISHVIHELRLEARGAGRLGAYALGPRLGEGASGVVYRARHLLLGRDAAIKILRPERASDANVQRFEREARLASRLRHPNAVAVYEYGRTEDGLRYFAMEHCPGVDLERLVALEGPLPPARVAHLVRQLCCALGEAHGLGLVHRDIKPANVIVGCHAGLRDVVKVADFGLARDLDPTASRSAGASEGAIAGTPAYLSPEAIESPASVDARSDLYSVGAVAYFLATGTRVFQVDGLLGLIASHLTAAPEPPSRRLGRPLPPELEALIMACLEKRPEARPQSAYEIARRLAPLAAGWAQREPS